jgi:protease-4
VLLSILALCVVSPGAWGQWDELFKKGREALTGASETQRQIAYFRIKGPLAETPVMLPPLFGGEPPLSLKALLERFKEARLDSNVVAVVVDLQDAQLGAAQLEDVHEAMRKFAAVDKPVYVHADALMMGTYAAATGASHISLVPTGDLWLIGLYSESPFVRGLLDKIGVVPDFEQFEDYKTAAEIFMRAEPSAENKEMINWLVDGIYAALVKRIATGRNMTEDKVRGLIDGGPYTAEEALKAGLVDSVQHRQDFVAGLKKKHGEDVKIVMDYGDRHEFSPPEDPFAIFGFVMELLNPKPKSITGPTVAVVYVDGPIQTGTAQPSPFGGESGAYSTTIRRALDKAADEPQVRAVVLRVDSPGGSALASEIILDATKRVAKKKPLIVSMGNVAASGGYYVSCGAETIFAEPSTITASIGVIGGKLVTTGMWDKLGVNWHPVQRGQMAAIMSTAKTWNEAERAKIRRYMEEIYTIFKNHIVAHRGERLHKPIEKVAGGRVFTGAQALELGLVDRLGGLEDAIQFAAQKAGVSDYDIRVIPEPPSFFDLFMPREEDEEYMDAAAGPVSFASNPAVAEMLQSLAMVDPLRAAALLSALKRLDLIQRETVITMMPFELVIR